MNDAQERAGSGDARTDGRDSKGRWKPGTPGNPNGSSQAARTRTSLTAAMRKLLTRQVGADELRMMTENFGLTRRQKRFLARCENRQEVLAELLIIRSMGGNLATFQEVFDRLDPKPKRTEISGPGGAPVRALVGAYDLDEASAEAAYRSALAGDDLEEDDEG